MLGNLIGSIFNQEPNPTVNVRSQIDGFMYDAVENAFGFGGVSSRGRGIDISGKSAKQVASQVESVLEHQAKVWTDVLNLFPMIVHDQMIPAIDHANQFLQIAFGKLKFSEGGSRSIKEEIEELALRRGPGPFLQRHARDYRRGPRRVI